jgi:hypothetical protein
MCNPVFDVQVPSKYGTEIVGCQALPQTQTGSGAAEFAQTVHTPRMIGNSHSTFQVLREYSMIRIPE